MTKLSITSKGHVTLRKEVLRHLGLRPGDKVAVDLLAVPMPAKVRIARNAVRIVEDGGNAARLLS